MIGKNSKDIIFIIDNWARVHKTFQIADFMKFILNSNIDQSDGWKLKIWENPQGFEENLNLRFFMKPGPGPEMNCFGKGTACIIFA